MKTLEQIKNHPTYQQIINDSFGGIIYNMANINKYNDGKDELLALWKTIENKDSAGGIIKGAMNFLKGN